MEHSRSNGARNLAIIGRRILRQIFAKERSRYFCNVLCFLLQFLFFIYVLAILDNIPALALAKQQKVIDNYDVLKKQAADKLEEIEKKKKEAIDKFDLLRYQSNKVNKKRKLDSSSSPSTSGASTSSHSPSATSTPLSKTTPAPEDEALLRDESFLSVFFDDDNCSPGTSPVLDKSVQSVSSLQKQNAPTTVQAKGDSTTSLFQKVLAQSTGALTQQSTETAQAEIEESNQKNTDPSTTTLPKKIAEKNQLKQKTNNENKAPASQKRRITGPSKED